MDQFYQVLRKVQKKERNNGILAPVDETFYSDIRNYLDKVKKEAINDPFSNAHRTLKEAQLIATEICERREHKITDAAVINIHRSYRSFSGKKVEFDLVDTTPLNLTPEEEKLYYSLIDTLKNHKNQISLDEKKQEKKMPIIQEKREEPIIKAPEPKKTDEKASKKEVKSSVKSLDEVTKDDEFYDFESKKIEKDSEIVTMLVFDEIGAIMGVDEKVYGPFKPQDIVQLPLINAKVFFKNRKGRQVKI